MTITNGVTYTRNVKHYNKVKENIFLGSYLLVLSHFINGDNKTIFLLLWFLSLTQNS